MGKFIESFPVSSLRGADYNPRAIDPSAFERLQQSLREIGTVKPIIATADGLIVAGHQRTKGLRSIGRQSAPVYLLDSISVSDEIRFNQLHNGTDADALTGEVKVLPSDCTGFAERSGRDVRGEGRAPGAVVRKEICALLVKYGNWGGAVATQSGEVLTGGNYALCCQLLGLPCRVYYVPDAQAALVREFFAASYGRFSYDHLNRKTYVQSFAQLFRLRDGARRSNSSPLYERFVLPALRPHERLLDFGCGQGDYVKRLKSRGHDASGVELFARRGESLDVAAVNVMCGDLCAALELDGLFDVVVCDYVLNSVDSLEAEADVLTCLNAFCKSGGRLYYSGRDPRHLEGQLKATSFKNKQRWIEFVDAEGFTALYRKGNWFYQKFHTPEQVKALTERFLSRAAPVRFETEGRVWQAEAVKDLALPTAQIEGAIAREFNVRYPQGRRLGRHADLIGAWRTAQAREENLK